VRPRSMNRGDTTVSVISVIAITAHLSGYALYPDGCAVFYIGRDAEISRHFCPLRTGAAAIEVKSDLISVVNIPEFIEAVGSADSMTVDWLYSGKPDLVLTFNNVLTLVGICELFTGC